MPVMHSYHPYFSYDRFLTERNMIRYIYGNHVRGHEKIHRAIKKNWGQLCFEKRHFGGHGLPQLLNNFLRKAHYSTRGVV